MICKNCGNMIQNGAAFCQSCGTKIETSLNNKEASSNLINPMENNTANTNYNQNTNYQDTNNVNMTNPNMPAEKGTKARSNSIYLAFVGLFMTLFINIIVGLGLSVCSLAVAFSERNKIDEKSFKKAIIIDVICIILSILTIAFEVFISAKYI